MTYRKQELSLEEIDKVTSQHGQGQPDVPAADGRRAVPAQGHRRDRQDLPQEHRACGTSASRPTAARRRARSRSSKDAVRELPRPRPPHRRVARRRRRAARRDPRLPRALQALDRDVQGAARDREALQELQRAGGDHGLQAQRGRADRELRVVPREPRRRHRLHAADARQPQGAAREVLRRREVPGVRRSHGEGVQERLALGLRPLPVRRLHQREAHRAPQPDRRRSRARTSTRFPATPGTSAARCSPTATSTRASC